MRKSQQFLLQLTLYPTVHKFKLPKVTKKFYAEKWSLNFQTVIKRPGPNSRRLGSSYFLSQFAQQTSLLYADLLCTKFGIKLSIDSTLKGPFCSTINTGTHSQAFKAQITDTFFCTEGTMNKQLRAAIYTRVSTDDQSCERQLRDLTAFAERAGYTVVATFTETASGTRNDRAQRSDVIALARSRNIDVILVTELTRWGRSTIDLLQTLQELKSYGVSVVAQTGFQFDLSTPQGKMLATVLSGLAEFERDLLSERTKSGLSAAVARGKKLGRPKGDRTTAEHRSKVLKLRADGLSMDAVAAKLHISKSTVSKIEKEK